MRFVQFNGSPLSTQRRSRLNIEQNDRTTTVKETTQQQAMSLSAVHNNYTVSKTPTWGSRGFICNANSLLLSFIFYSLLYNPLLTQPRVCAGLFACLLFTLLFSADRDSGTTLTPVRMTERERGKRENQRRFVYSTLPTLIQGGQWQTQTTSTPRLPFPPPPPTYKGQGEHNDTVILNTGRAEQTKDTQRSRWNDFSHQTHWGVNFQMSESKTGPGAVEQDAARAVACVGVCDPFTSELMDF